MVGFGATIPPLIYNDGQYYFSNPFNSNDFWNSSFTYSDFDVVTYKNKNWVSLTSSNITIPSENSGINIGGEFFSTWEETGVSVRWNPVSIWKSDFEYDVSSWQQNSFGFGNYVIHDDVVYGSTSSPVYGVPPPLDNNWRRIYSLEPDTSYFYGPSISNNNIIEMNGKYYECVGNNFNGSLSSDTLINYSIDNGIYIVINEKFKNVLINIYVNDNTYSEVSEISQSVWDVTSNNVKNTNRDDIYTTIFSKLSTNNFMNCLNDLSNKFGFSDNVKYVVVGESGTKLYDFNNLKSVVNLPYLLTCSGPDELLVRTRSNIYQPITLKGSEIKSKRILNDSNIENLSELNYFNEMHLASKISKNVESPIILPNYSGLKNQIYYRLYRFSGYYGPILRNIELFDSPSLTQSETNYRFDTELTNFGIVKERIVSKVNRKSNLLRFANQTNLKSIYPMIDEFGYHTVDYFMFKSTWDLNYHIETQDYVPELQTTQLKPNNQDLSSKEFRNNNSKLL